MRIKRTMPALLAAALLSVGSFASPTDGLKVYREGLKLYQDGLYEGARTLFENVRGDELTDGYALLCALKLRSNDAGTLYGEYFRLYPSSSLEGIIRLQNARNLFDDGRYAAALEELSLVSGEAIPENCMAEYMFKCGYSNFALGNFAQAENFLVVIEALPFSDYNAPAQYYRGVMEYENRHFDRAEALFWKASADPRFSSLTDFYVVDCEFNQKNYDFAIREGEKIYDQMPPARKQRLARIISESYLIKGDSQNALRFYDNLNQTEMSRKDYFYAATVLYQADDYRGAISNFEKMTDRSDSLGQIANYQLANSYLRTRNQVSAMGAFLEASKVDFDPQITEDALFNYAKLAFDLNKDTDGFVQYMRRYSTRQRGTEIYGYMALAALVDRDYAAAVAAYDNIDELDPDMYSNYTKANFLRAEQLFSSGSYRDAAPYFRATAYYLPKTDRLNQLSRYWYAESNYRTGNWAEAQKSFTELYNADALNFCSEGRVLPYNIAYCLFQQGDYAQAARWFDTYARSSDKLFREDALNRRADCDFAMRNYKEAVRSYQKVLNEYYTADNIYPYYRQALAYGLSGDKKKKVATLLHVEDADPSAPLYNEASYELGRAQMEVGDNNDAIRSFKRLMETTSDPTYVSRALIGLGMVNRNMSRLDEALNYYKQVVDQARGSSYAEEALLAIESIYRTRKQPDKYLEYVEQKRLNTGKSEEDKAKMYFNTAEQLYLAQNWQQTVSSCQAYLDKYPEGADRLQAEFYMAEAYKAQGQKEKACEWYGKVMKHDVQSSFVELSKLNFANISYSLERYPDAYQAYLSLLASAVMDANRKTASIGMMRSAYKAKDYASAISSADGVLALKDKAAELEREAKYIKAKSCLASSKRSEAMAIFKVLSAECSTPEGAEASYYLIQDLYDTGNFDQVESHVYAFSKDAGDQSYWLARAFIVLADSFTERGQYDQAKATYESVRDGYEPQEGPDDIASTVNMRMERLENLMK